MRKLVIKNTVPRINYYPITSAIKGLGALKAGAPEAFSFNSIFIGKKSHLIRFIDRN